jgi:hypothetical protein
MSCLRVAALKAGIQHLLRFVNAVDDPSVYAAARRTPVLTADTPGPIAAGMNLANDIDQFVARALISASAVNARTRLASAMGLAPKKRLNSRVNWEALS